jgi:acyl-CoA synthetase (AMP-forming)/AMP-acid ligase II
MILGDVPPQMPDGPLAGAVTTLDDMFRRALMRHPDAVAMVDPLNRESFTDGMPRYMTWAQADTMISAIAMRLRRLGLSTDSVIGIQLPNTVEGILTLLGVLRAGLIAAPIPLLWRQADCIAALSRVGVKALIACGRVGPTNHGRLAMEVAAEIFPVRYVCGFGAAPDDGIVPFDDLFDLTDVSYTAAAAPHRNGHAADHVAVITWDITAQGLVPVARSHRELVAAGLAVVLENPLPEGEAILSAMMPASFCGVTVALMPWLLNGGTLVLHHPFDPAIMAAQIAQHRCALAILPGPIIPRLVEGRVLSEDHGLRSILAVWRAPERLATAAPWRRADMDCTDVLSFGEVALFALKRAPNGRAPLLPRGPVVVPREAAGAVQIAETMVTAKGTLAIRGPMAPRGAFPPGAERGGATCLDIDAQGYVDTGYPCRHDAASDAIILGGPPSGVVSVGGYRFVMRDLQNLVARAGPLTTLAALPDTFAGHRLAGNAEDRRGMQEALINYGANPLVVRAFRERARPPAEA